MKFTRKPSLTTKDEADRLRFAAKHMSWTKEWYQVLFSDEKRFCLDGADCYSYYFHNISKEVNSYLTSNGWWWSHDLGCNKQF